MSLPQSQRKQGTEYGRFAPTRIAHPAAVICGEFDAARGNPARMLTLQLIARRPQQSGTTPAAQVSR